MSKKRPSKQPTTSQELPKAPLAIRLGGAFLILALAFLIFETISVINNGLGGNIEFTAKHLLILIAAAIFGAFPNPRIDPVAKRIYLLVLLVVLLAFASKAIAHTVLMVMPQWWLVLYAIVCGVCALVLRRSAAKA